MTQSEAKQYCDGFLDGKHAAANSILEHISNLRKDANNGYMFDMVDEIEKRALVLKGGEVSAADSFPARRGMWLDKKITIKKAHGMAYGRWSCSACKAKQPYRSNFCPNCGADMRREEEECKTTV